MCLQASRQPNAYWLLAIACLLLAALASPAAAGPFNITFGMGWEGRYRPGEWTPLEFHIVNQTKETNFDGVLRVTALQDNRTQMIISHPMALAAKGVLPLPLVTKLVYRADSCSVELSSTELSDRLNIDLIAGGIGAKAEALSLDDTLVGVVGKKGFGLASLGQHVVSTAEGAGGERGKLYTCGKVPDQLPWDWTGYKSLDLLVLYAPDWTRIKDQQAKAIYEFVSGGGRLLIILGDKPVPTAGAWGKLVPLKIDTPKERQIEPAAIQLTWGQMKAQKLPVWTLPAELPAGWKSDASLLVYGNVGFGQVAILPLDPEGLQPALDAEACAPFWQACMAKLLPAGRSIKIGASGRSSDDGRAYNQQGSEVVPGAAQTDKVIEHLYRIPELRPLSIWWVVSLLGLLALLLGPVDYLVLKKLDRLPLTWITSAVIITLFTVGAYYGVKSLRAGSMQVRAVTVIDGVGDHAWSSHTCGIFAPDSDDYRIVDTDPASWWAGLSAASGDRYSSRGGELLTHKIYCVQKDGGNRPESVPINIWSMQCLTSESPAAAMPISAEITRKGDMTIAKIANLSQQEIRGGAVMLGKGRLWTFDSIPAGAARTFELETRKLRGGEWQLSQGGVASSDIFGATICRQRTAAVDSYFRDGAIVVLAEFAKAPLPYKVADRTYETDHIQIARLVVVPK